MSGFPPPGGNYQPPAYGDPNAQPSYAPGYGPPPPTFGFQPPPAGYQPPPAGYQPPSAGYQPPTAGYQPPPAGYQPPTAGYQPPTAGYQPPPGGYQPSPGYYPAAYPTGTSVPPGPGQPQTWPAGAVAPAPDRPQREHCFFIKNEASGYVLEVQGSSVDPGTKVVTSVQQPQGQDSQLWFEDAQTGSIKSRLNLLCLDLQVSSPGFQLTKSRTAPKGTISLSNQTDGAGAHFNVVAHCQWGVVPGKAKNGTCWYSYAGKEHLTSDYSWIISPGASALRNTGTIPPGAMAVGHLSDGSGIQYAAIARTKWGTIPGRAQGTTCYYPYAGREQSTSDFDWLIAEQNVLIVNPFIPGNVNQQWLRAGNRIQNRSDPNKLLQVNHKTVGGTVTTSGHTGQTQQLWSFPNPGPGQPAGAVPFGGTYGNSPPTPLNHEPFRPFVLRSQLHGKVLDIKAAIKKPGTPVIVWPKHHKNVPDPNQLWYMDKDGIIRSKLNDLGLESHARGVWMKNYQAFPNQKWTFSGNKIIDKDSPGHCLEISGSNKSDGAAVARGAYKGTANQQWYADYI